MNRRISTGFLFALGVFAAGCTSITPTMPMRELPAPQQGFHWEVFDEVSVSILCPEGWHKAISMGKGTYTGSLSLEDFKKDGLFLTGFTVQVIWDVKKRTGHPASMMAVALAQEISDTPHNKVLEVNPLKENGAVRSGFIRYRNAPALGAKITVHKFFVAVDRSERLYIYTFESPDDTWDGAFQNYGIPMMEKILMTR